MYNQIIYIGYKGIPIPSPFVEVGTTMYLGKHMKPSSVTVSSSSAGLGVLVVVAKGVGEGQRSRVRVEKEIHP